MCYSKLTKFLFSCWKRSNANDEEYDSSRTGTQSGDVSRYVKYPDNGNDQFICEKFVGTSWWAFGAKEKMLADQAGIEIMWSMPQSDGTIAMMDSDGCSWYDTYAT